MYLLSYYDDQTLCSKIAADYNAKLHIIEGGAHGFGKKHDAISIAYLRRFVGMSHPWQSNGDPVRTAPR